MKKLVNMHRIEIKNIEVGHYYVNNIIIIKKDCKKLFESALRRTTVETSSL